MFTGIIESLAKVVQIEVEGSNKRFILEVPFVNELKVDQSVAHSGVCLTVEKLNKETYEVVAIDETLNKTNLSHWKEGDKINLERCMSANARFDGHIVQGHIDGTAELIKIEEVSGSWNLDFKHLPEIGLTVEKGSVCINGISLTVVNSKADGFSVSIIPYTWEHTNLHSLKPGDTANIEFDILGKYIQKMVNKSI